MAITDSDSMSFLVRDDDEGIFSRNDKGILLRKDDPSVSDYDKIITLQIDGQTVQVPLATPLKDANGNEIRDLNGQTTPRYTTIFDAANELYVKEIGDQEKNPIPVLCHQPHMTPVAVCRLCMVQIYGQKRGKRTAERKLLPACQYQVAEGMEVFTMMAQGPDGDRVRSTVKMMTEFLAADHLKPSERTPEISEFNELGQLARRVGAEPTRLKKEALSQPAPARDPLASRRSLDESSPVFSIDHSACILCDRCVRACGEVKHNEVIGRTGKGAVTGIGFDLNLPMADSSCVQCGECMVSCPTTAITFKPVARINNTSLTGTSEILPPQELLNDPLFRGISPKFLLWQQGLVVRRRLSKGEMVCRQGDPGNTAFIIKKGRLKVKVYATAPGSNGKRGLGPLSSQPVFQTELTPENLIFGEMACLSSQPRSADVEALEAGEVWELRRNVLDRLMRLPNQRLRIEKEYRERALDLVLRTTQLFSELPEDVFRDVVGFLRERISFARVNPGQTICRRGAKGTDFYIIRVGYVQVDISRFGKESSQILAVGPGSMLGEMSLLGLSDDAAYRSSDEIDRDLEQRLNQSTERVSDVLLVGTQTATVTSLDYVELARLKRDDFFVLLKKFPIIRRRLVEEATRRLSLKLDLTGLSSEYVQQGLYEARNMLAIDLDRCTRCDECTRGCVHNHGNESHGVPVARMLRDGKRFANYLVATSCRSCEIPHCMSGCPVDAIHRGKHLQIVIEDHCIGCGLCADNCPYGSITLQETQFASSSAMVHTKAVNCDLCDSHDQQLTPKPACVSSCPHDAAFRISGPELLTRALLRTNR